MRIGLRALGVTVALLAFTAPAAGAKDYAQTALNIIPSGQWGGLPIPAGADSQALMYDGLTPLFDQVSDADLDTYFKSEGFGVGPDGPATIEPVPRPGVTIERDRFNVPHVTGQTHDDGIWAAGWIAAEDRGLLARAGPLQRARRRDRRPRRDRDQPDPRPALVHPEPRNRGRGRQADPGARERRQGGASRPARHRRLHLRDQRLHRLRRARRRAVDAQRRLRAQRAQGPVPRPGRRRRGAALAVPRRPPAAARQAQGRQASSTTCASSRTPSCRPRSTAGSRTARSPSTRPATRSSTRAATSRSRSTPGLRPARTEPAQASNTLMITKGRSATGRPLMVGGPQIGYFYPGLHLGDRDARR